MVRRFALFFAISLTLYGCSKQRVNIPEHPKSNKPVVEVRVSPKFFVESYTKTRVYLTITIQNPGEEFYCPGYQIAWEGVQDADGSLHESDCPPYDPSAPNEPIRIYESHQYFSGHHLIKVI